MNTFDQQNFLKILQSVDAFFPVGAFTLSNGLEDYVVSEKIQSVEELRGYLNGFLQVFPYNDLGILSLAYRNCREHEFLLELDGVSCAMKGAKEIRNGTVRMCSRYVKAREAMEDCEGELLWYREQISLGRATGNHPQALGIYAAGIGMEQNILLTMYAYSIVSAIVNNAVKLVPLSQMEGQKLLYETLEQLPNAAQRAEQVTIEELGVSGGAYEIHCMKHEHLYSRQYMS